jgi:hypothetical protein
MLKCLFFLIFFCVYFSFHFFHRFLNLLVACCSFLFSAALSRGVFLLDCVELVEEVEGMVCFSGDDLKKSIPGVVFDVSTLSWGCDGGGV